MKWENTTEPDTGALDAGWPKGDTLSVQTAQRPGSRRGKQRFRWSRWDVRQIGAGRPWASCLDPSRIRDAGWTTRTANGSWSTGARGGDGSGDP
ncbi:MAG: hypothetical protein AVDCRST_MAG33-280 [uncultured Thermomicrobiales bacterium]|uniref:Uncharacterized protein n=1 Tax=uncultured Thermomicrobiales bacterium TaxID=1645740 RepID=A0A6J4UBN7_9BACT|nr:MAG: hypothetical protein AVDCRST_MAG33-280 [uncultured Thermomicrobiales bacterium]